MLRTTQPRESRSGQLATEFGVYETATPISDRTLALLPHLAKARVAGAISVAAIYDSVTISEMVDSFYPDANNNRKSQLAIELASLLHRSVGATDGFDLEIPERGFGGAVFETNYYGKRIAHLAAMLLEWSAESETISAEDCFPQHSIDNWSLHGTRVRFELLDRISLARGFAIPNPIDRSSHTTPQESLLRRLKEKGIIANVPLGDNTRNCKPSELPRYRLIPDACDKVVKVEDVYTAILKRVQDKWNAGEQDYCAYGESYARILGKYAGDNLPARAFVALEQLVQDGILLRTKPSGIRGYAISFIREPYRRLIRNLVGRIRHFDEKILPDPQ